jgi:hypothetical protein
MEIKKTITSIFIVPILKINKDDLKNNGYSNGYVEDDRKDVQYENSLYLLFKPENLDRFRTFLDNEYERTKNIIDDYDYENGYVVIVYKIDDKFKKDVQLIKEGKYSKTSKVFQEMFPKTIKIQRDGLSRDEISLQYRVFNKTPDLIEFWEKKLNVTFDDAQELWEMFVKEEEILNLDKIK